VSANEATYASDRPGCQKAPSRTFVRPGTPGVDTQHRIATRRTSCRDLQASRGGRRRTATAIPAFRGRGNARMIRGQTAGPGRADRGHDLGPGVLPPIEGEGPVARALPASRDSRAEDRGRGRGVGDTPTAWPLRSRRARPAETRPAGEETAARRPLPRKRQRVSALHGAQESDAPSPAGWYGIRLPGPGASSVRGRLHQARRPMTSIGMGLPAAGSSGRRGRGYQAGTRRIVRGNGGDARSGGCLIHRRGRTG